MVSCCFKITVFVGFVISMWDFVTDVLATYEFHQVMDSYSDNANTIEEGKSGDGASNYKADSAFFTALTAEYDSLSAFDQEYVYCDVRAIQSEPDSLLKETKNIFYAACAFVGLSLMALLFGYIMLCRMVRSGDIASGVDAGLTREKLWVFTSKSAIQFLEAGPQLCIVALMIMRSGQLNGYVCQEKFFNCGESGDCTMSDLMVPVALNAPLLDIAASDIILAISFVAGLVDVTWNFLSGAALFIGAGQPKFLVMPCIQLCLGTLPLFWVIYIEGLLPTGRTSDDEGIVVIVLAVVLSLCFCCSVFFFTCMGTTGKLDGPQGVEMTKVQGRARASTSRVDHDYTKKLGL